MTDEVKTDVVEPKTFTQEEVDTLIAEQVGGLKSKVDELLGEKKAEADKRKQAEDEAKAQADEIARKNGNLEAIEESWRNKFLERETDLLNQLNASSAKNYELTVGRKSQELAGMLAKPHAQGLLAKEIKERLTLDENGNIRVLDLQGKPTALTIDELVTQLKADPTYQDIIVINNSTGSGATGGGFGGGAAKNPKEMTEQERIDLYNRDPVLFKQLFSK